MAVNTSRSLNGGLRDGATDGSLKKRRPHTADTPANTAATLKARANLLPTEGFSYGGDAPSCGGDLAQH